MQVFLSFLVIILICFYVIMLCIVSSVLDGGQRGAVFPVMVAPRAFILCFSPGTAAQESVRGCLFCCPWCCFGGNYFLAVTT